VDSTRASVHSRIEERCRPLCDDDRNAMAIEQPNAPPPVIAISGYLTQAKLAEPVVEYDGDDHYRHSIQIKADRAKDHAARISGCRIVRFPYWVQLDQSHRFGTISVWKRKLSSRFRTDSSRRSFFPPRSASLALSGSESRVCVSSSQPDKLHVPQVAVWRPFHEPEVTDQLRAEASGTHAFSLR